VKNVRPPAKTLSLFAEALQEANIVDALRSNGAALLSLVATLDRHIVGPILHSSAAIGDLNGAALGPMAV
jgi:predicted N-acetyltransferase YhbS